MKCAVFTLTTYCRVQRMLSKKRSCIVLGKKRLKMLTRLICFSTLEVVIKNCDRISLLLSRHQSSMLTLSQ